MDEAMFTQTTVYDTFRDDCAVMALEKMLEGMTLHKDGRPAFGVNAMKRISRELSKAAYILADAMTAERAKGAG